MWCKYLQSAHLEDIQREIITKQLTTELQGARSLLADLEQEDIHPPQWLQESIYLRSSLIAPLNLLQIEALKSEDMDLLRITVAGIALGMQSTG